MTTILLVILGVLLAAAAVLMVVYYGGDAFGNGRIEAEAGRLVTEGAQIEGAMELYYRQEGSYPRDADPIAQMISAKYLTHAPLGTRTTERDKWAIDYDAGMIRAMLGPTSDKDTMAICHKARQQLDLPATGTSTGIYRCDGTDSPGGKLGGREPCCVGPVGVGGGPFIPNDPNYEPPFVQQYDCGQGMPPATASATDRSIWLGCYSKQVVSAAKYWIYAGKGMTPTIDQLYDAGYISTRAPNYPEIGFIGLSNSGTSYIDFAWNAPANDKPVFFWITFNGAGLAKGVAMSVPTAQNSGGFLTAGGGGYYHAYSQPIYYPHEYEEKVLVKKPVWDRAVPTEASSLDEKAAYTAYRMLFVYWATKDAIANGATYTQNGLSEAQLRALGYEIPEKGNWTQTDTIYLRTTTSIYGTGTPGTAGPNFYTLYYYREDWAQNFCNKVVAYSYNFLKCNSYSTNWYNATPRIAP